MYWSSSYEGIAKGRHRRTVGQTVNAGEARRPQRGERNDVVNPPCRVRARLRLRSFRLNMSVFPRTIAYGDHGRMAYLPAASSAITRYVKPPSDT